MTSLTYSEDSGYSSKEKIKNNILKIFIYYCILSFGIFLLFISAKFLYEYFKL